MSRMELKSLYCSVCLQDFDQDDNLPRILTKCGHSFCNTCIPGCITQRAGILNFQLLTCPLCKEIYVIGVLNWKDLFPVNFKLIEAVNIVNNYKTQTNQIKADICQEHRKIENELCLDRNCKNGVTNCIRCLIRDHNSCSAEYFLQWNELPHRIEFQSYHMERVQLVETISSIIANYNEKAQKKVKEILRAFYDSIKNILTESNFDSFQRDPTKFEVQIVPQDNSDISPSFLIEPINKAKCEEILNIDKIDKMLSKLMSSEIFDQLRIPLEEYLKPLLTSEDQNGYAEHNGLISGN